MKHTILLFILLLTFLPAFAQQEATTHDGKKVILYPDGTWKPADSEKAFKVIRIENLELPHSKSQENILHHTGYTLSYNLSHKQANWVAYELTAEETKSVFARKNNFIPDPLLKSGSASNADYQGSDYDRGHLAPAADMGYSNQTMVESFYLSNMSPQTRGFNRGIWKKLEEQVRQWAIENKAVYIVTGGVLTSGLPTLGGNRISIPQYFYKVILDYTEPEIKGIGFIMPNKESKETLKDLAITIDSVEKVTGIDFFYQLPDSQENLIESKKDVTKWSWTTSSTHSKDE
jgi:endonuclease G